MKNKKVVLLLTAMVIGIWGVIFYKFFVGRQSGDGISSAPIKKSAHKEIAKKRLSLNYPDPFKEVRTRITRKAPIVSPQANNTSIDEAIYIDFEYAGVIEYNKKMKAVINRDGRSIIRAKGDSISRFKIISITKDSIIIRGKMIHIIRK